MCLCPLTIRPDWVILLDLPKIEKMAITQSDPQSTDLCPLFDTIIDIRGEKAYIAVGGKRGDYDFFFCLWKRSNSVQSVAK